jgi:hypothetical protein
MIDASSLAMSCRNAAWIKLGAMSDLRQDLGGERQIKPRPASIALSSQQRE